jgi:hypothetical protein
MIILTSEGDIKTFLESFWIEEEENVIHAEKAFVVNAAMRYIFKKLQNEEIPESKVGQFFGILEDFKNGKVDLRWKDGNLYTVKF